MKSLTLGCGVVALLISAVMELSAQESPMLPVQMSDTVVNNMTDAIQARHWVDRTAIFAGDQVNYYVEIVSARDVEILVEDLEPTQLQLNGLELVDSEQGSSVTDNGVIWHARYTFTTFDTSTSLMQIGAQTIRYYAQRSASGADRAMPSGEVVIPPTLLALRSTLAAEPMRSRLRDKLSGDIVHADIGWPGKAGLLLLLISAAPTGWIVLSVFRQRSVSVRQQQAVQATVQAEQGILDKLGHISPGNATERRQGYDQLELILRDLLAQSGYTNANALTAADLADSTSMQSPGIPVDQLVAVVADCELARYGRPEQLPAADRFESGIELVRRMLTAH